MEKLKVTVPGKYELASDNVRTAVELELDEVVSKVTDNKVSEIILPEGLPVTVLIVLSGRVLVPEMDYVLSGNVLQFTPCVHVASSVSLLSLQTGNLLWATNFVSILKEYVP
jgi:hypothetical protein